jgi:Protein of unknown function (DUF4239)
MGVEHLLLWIESQSSSSIAVIAFGFCYVAAAFVFALSQAAASRRIAVELKATTPVMLTPLAVILGLLIAFVASHVWENVDRANAYVRGEADAIQTTLVFADAFPPSTRAEVRNALRNYLQFTTMEDWPAMMEGRAVAHRSPAGLSEAMTLVLSIVPSTPGEEIAQRQTARAIAQVLDARRNRVTLSGASIMPMQWVVIVVLAALMLLTIAMVHLDKPFAMAVNLFSLSTAVAACFVLLLANDRPFSAGGNAVEPGALTHVVID